MASSALPDVLDGGIHASRPAATDVVAGATYSCTTHGLEYQSDGATWSTRSTFGTAGAYVAGGTDVAIADGGTGASTKAGGFDALSPMSASGDIIYGGASGTGTRLPKGSNGDVLTLAAGLPSWAAPSGGSALTVKDEGSNLDTAVTSIDFVGAGVVATNSTHAVTVTIAGGGGSGVGDKLYLASNFR